MVSSRTVLVFLLALVSVRESTAKVDTRILENALLQRGTSLATKNGLAVVERRLQDDPAVVDHDDHDDHDEEEHGDEGDESLEEKPWGAVILTSLLINLTSLSGLVVVVLGVATKKWYTRDVNKEDRFDWKFTHNMIPSFACGALIATACFLIIPESIEMISHYLEEEAASAAASHEGEDDHGAGNRTLRFLQDEHADDEEHAEEDSDGPLAWRFGVSVVCGFLLPVLTSIIFPHYHEPELCEICEADLKDRRIASTAETSDLTSTKRKAAREASLLAAPQEQPTSKEDQSLPPQRVPPESNTQLELSVDSLCGDCPHEEEHHDEDKHEHEHEHEDDCHGCDDCVVESGTFVSSFVEMQDGVVFMSLLFSNILHFVSTSLQTIPIPSNPNPSTGTWLLPS
jgi:NAD-dependent dihydropyrimidine dehydrogenase PreA subunit